MGFLGDIITTAKDIASITHDVIGDNLFNRRRHSSISRRSLEGILQFPVIVSRSIDIDTLQMTTKALEKQFASFLQVALTMDPFLNLSSDRDAAGYLKRFHSNSGVKSNLLNDSISAFASINVESYNVYSDEELDRFMIIGVTEGATDEIILANKEALTNVMEGLRTDVVNNRFIPRTEYRFKDPVNQRLYSKVTEAKGWDRMPLPKRDNDSYDHKLPNNVLIDNDVKKSNELVPTSMHIRTILRNKQGSTDGSLDFIVGVKATMHPVSTSEMIENVSHVIKSGGKLFKTIRWTSGEISFAKDYVLNLTEIKDDAMKQSKSTGNSRWFAALKHRRKLSSIKGLFAAQGGMLPNASIVMSMEEVEYIKNNMGFDLLNPNVVYKIMREYFLISFVVVDSGSAVIHALFDGNEDFQTVTFSGLERGDIAGRGVDFKDVLKLVQRV